MPYSNVSELPAAVRAKLKGKRLRQWMHVFNSEYDRHGDESRAFASAWSAAQKSATGKRTKVDVAYQYVPRGNSRCGLCTMFLPPNSCSAVEGQISPNGYCELFKRKPDMEKAAQTESFNFFLPLSKVQKNADGSCTVAGYASTPALDLDGEIVSLDAIRKALPGYWEYRNIREMHTNSAVGVGKEANIDDKGLFLTAKVVDSEAVKKCIEGVYKGFSIGGRKLNKSGNTITEIEWIETSIVDRPANPECKFEVAKRAKDAPQGAFLLKSRSFRPASSRALAKMAQAVELLAKGNEENLTEPGPSEFIKSGDGFSAPAKPSGALCKHGNIADTCNKCAAKVAKREAKMKKREFNAQQRASAASSGAALPDGSFPIKNKQDLMNARRAVGRAKNPDKARAHIRSRAAALGVTLPDNWSKKLAKQLISNAILSSRSAEPAFLNLEAADTRRSPVFVEGSLRAMTKGRKAGTDLDMELNTNFLALKGTETMTKVNTEKTDDPVAKMVMDMLKAGREPSRAQRFQMARDNMRKTRKMRKETAVAVEKAHKILKGAYLAKQALLKAGKKPADDNDADDFVEKAMGELQKAYSAVTKLGTFAKAASMNLKKAASRSGQRGQEVTDGEGRFYTVPAGVKATSPSELATAGPGGDASGSEPPILDMMTPFPGKSAKVKKGFVSQTEAEALARAAAAEARADLLEKLPAGAKNGRGPVAFDTSKIIAGGSSKEQNEVLYKGINPADLASNDERTHEAAVGKMIGNMIFGGMGRNVIFDPEFHGTAGAKE